jgi:phospholipid transport system substrate-binding protein
VFKILADPELEGNAKLSERRTAIVTVASEIFDFGEMAKRSLGQYRAERTSAERGEFVRLFTAVVEHSYISKVDQRGAGKMTVHGEQIDGEYAIVRTTLYRAQFNKIIRTSSYGALVDKFRSLQADPSAASSASGAAR